MRQLSAAPPLKITTELASHFLDTTKAGKLAIDVPASRLKFKTFSAADRTLAPENIPAPIRAARAQQEWPSDVRQRIRTHPNNRNRHIINQKIDTASAEVVWDPEQTRIPARCEVGPTMSTAELPSETVQKWQEIVNIIAEIIHVPSAW